MSEPLNALTPAPATDPTPAAPAPAAPANGTPPSRGEDGAPKGDPAPPAGADGEGGLAAGTKAAPEAPTSPDPIDPASYTLALPETFQVDETTLTEARELFAAAGVPQDKAQSLIDLYAKTQTAQATAAATEFSTQQSAWLTELNAMPQFQGATRETSLAQIGRVFDEYGPTAREAFNNPLIGNNPEVVKFMLKIAGTLSEGAPSAPGRPANPGKEGRPAKSNGTLSYPNTPEIQGNL